MLTVSGYKSGLLTIKSWRIRNVGNLFSVSFSRVLTRYSAATAGRNSARNFLFWLALQNFPKTLFDQNKLKKKLKR